MPMYISRIPWRTEDPSDEHDGPFYEGNRQAENRMRTTDRIGEEAESDAYEEAPYHYVSREFAREEIEASAMMEEGVPFEVMLHDLEQILRDDELSKTESRTVPTKSD